MANGTFNPSKTALSRVWLVEGGSRADHTPIFKSCIKAMAASQAQGDIEKIECPSSEQFGMFEEVGVVQGTQDRETSSLVGRYPLDELSDLLRIAKARCLLDYQVNLGNCQDPRDFNDFVKKLIREDVYFTNYSSDDIGALSSDENAVVNETVDTSAKVLYEVVPLSLTKRGDDVIDNPGVDVVICDNPSCGDCDDESDGCNIIFGLATNTPGSPGTAPDIIWSDDGGATWNTDDIDSLLSSEEANALACLGDYVVVVSNDSASLHYKAKADILAGTALGWTEVATGFVAGGEPNDIWAMDNIAIIVGDGGYVYLLEDPTAGVDVLDAGVATTEDLNAVHGISDKYWVAVGDSDTVIVTDNQTVWNTSTSAPASGGNLLCVWVKSQREWWMGTSNGELWYTVNSGQAFTQDGLPGTGWLTVNDIAFSTKSVGYLSGARTIGGTARGQILRTFSGGGGNGTAGGWVILPEGLATIPNNDVITAIAACTNDANLVIGFGTADDALDGIIVVGE